MRKKRPIVKGKKLEQSLEDFKAELAAKGEAQFDRIKTALDKLDHNSILVVDLHNVLGEAWSEFAEAVGADTANRSGGGEKRVAPPPAEEVEK